MPGLFGIVRLGPAAADELDSMSAAFGRMARILRHRDEDRADAHADSAGAFLVGRIGLPHLDRSPWPAATEGNGANAQLFVSGPLFDGDRATWSDGRAEEALRTCRGSFSLLLHGRDGSTIVAADRRGSIPVFYANAGSWLLFAPEVKALFVSPSVSRDADPAAIGSLLAHGHLLGSQTLCRDVRRLRGGELLRVTDGRVARERYWTFAPGSAAGRTPVEDLQREFGDLIDAAAARHLGDPDRTIIFLSGGADSRGILGGALNAVSGDGSRLHTITWGTHPEREDSDVAVAGRLARQAGTRHQFRERHVAGYRELFTELNRLIDGLSELSALHPAEYRLMVDLRAAGFERGLRGDEVSGWGRLAATHEEALGLVYLRRLRDAPGLGRAVRREWYGRLCEASDAAIEDVLREVRHLPPNQAKDRLYYEHRLQCYLHTASYWKQIEIDQRNVLLDEPILDFMTRVPERLRVDKALYRSTLAHRYPDLAGIPLARHHNTENWSTLLATDGPVRTYALEELHDVSSRIWEYLDREALAGLLLAPSHPRPAPARGRAARARTVARTALERISPALLSWIQGRRNVRPTFPLAPASLVMRTLVLKGWFDTSASGVGSAAGDQ
jgi:asparagine synthetase B (glutamine-hydrolysing)